MFTWKTLLACDRDEGAVVEKLCSGAPCALMRISSARVAALRGSGEGKAGRLLNSVAMPESVIRPGKHQSFVERRIRRIVNARSVTIGLATTFVALALGGGILIKFVDHENFPTVGLGIWWALQTVTTVGYGDVVPTTVAGRVIGGIVMVIGIAFISFVTAGVTSALIPRAGGTTRAADRAHLEEAAQRIIDDVARNGDALAELRKRLEAIDAKLAG